MTFVLFLNAPVGLLEFTVDGVTAQCDKNFEGFKAFTPGIHFISYRYSRGNETGANTCLIIDCPKSTSPVLVFLWDKDSEQFKLTNSQAFADENILKYPHLAAYSAFMSQEGYAKWHKWTMNLSNSTLNRCLSSCKLSAVLPVYEVTPMDESHHSLMKTSSQETEQQARLQFTQIPSLKQFSLTATPEKVTKAACDRSVILESLQVSWEEWLAELELSFLLLVIGQNFEGFEQWIDILSLLAGSLAFAQAHSVEYGKLFVLLQVQFEFCPDDFFNGLLTDNKLFLMLSGLVSSVKAGEEVIQFCEFFEQRFGVQLQEFDLDEYGEYAPTVVE